MLRRPVKHILFLCTGNSARSIMAEAYFNAKGAPGWRAFSAGSHPAGKPNPLALDVLTSHGIMARGARSKSWSEFADASAPPLDVIVTVCDAAATEPCPVFPARPGATPRRIHWSLPDPAAAKGALEERRAVFESVFAEIRARIDALLEEAGG
jgi:arsenate reductase